MRLRLILNLLTASALSLSACTATATNAPQPTQTSTADATPRILITATSMIERQAVIKVVEEQVEFRGTEADSFAPAVPEDVLQVSGQVRTGTSGKTRLDLLPEGTIVRVGPSTIFILQALQTQPSDPITKIELAFGTLWIILSGGELDVQTPSGHAAVRGSYMSVDYDATTKRLRITCLEGQCKLENAQGDVELVDGQFSEIPGEGQAPTLPQLMTQNDYDLWKEVSPETQRLITPNATPIPSNLVPQGPIPTRPLTYSITNQCTDPNQIGGDWLWTFTRLSDEKGTSFTEMVNVALNRTKSGMLPAGFYLVTDTFPSGEQHTANVVTNSDNTTISVTGCASNGLIPVNPPSTGGTTVSPNPTLAGSETLRTTYTLTNNCATVWHWNFVGSQVINIDVPPGQTLSGTLPPGTFTVTDFFDLGELHGPSLVPGGGALNVSACTP